MRVGWSEVALGDVTTTRLGKMLSPAAKSGAVELPYLGNAEVRWGTLRLDALRTMTFSEKEQEEFSLRKGDVLICEGGEVGRTAVLQRDLPGVHFQKAIHRVRCSPLLDPQFLFRYMEFAAPSGRLDDYSSEATIRHLTGVKLRQLPVPLPPIEEQRRIASVLDAADALRAKRRQAIAKLDTLTQAIFIDAVAKSLDRMESLEDLVRSPITRGIDQPGPDTAGGVPYIKTTDFRAENLQRSDLACAGIDETQGFDRSIVETGDLVFCIRATVGPVMRVGADLAGVNLSRGTARISPAVTAHSRFLLEALRSPSFQQQVEGKLRGATFRQIPLKELRSLEVPVLRSGATEVVVEKLIEVDRLRSQFSESATKLNSLFASLQQRAFRGEL